ncbi:MAG: tetratricopeptide repeat protein [Burkholderiales bacterium]|nr:tetratricopeptide repeat protein [Burkholderiales bacterium]
MAKPPAGTMSLEAALQQAVAHHQAGRLQDAERFYRAILQAQPRHPDANHNMGCLAMQVGNHAAALPFLKTALDANPTVGQYWLSYVGTLIEAGQPDTARDVLAQGVSKGLRGETAYSNLGVAYTQLGRLADAEACYRNALETDPNYAEVYRNLGVLHFLQDRFADAAACQRRVLELHPEFADAYTDLLYFLPYDDNVDEAMLFKEYCGFGERFEAPLRKAWPKHANSRDPNRPLRVGLVSADFRHHAVANFIEPVLSQWVHDPSLALYAYYNHSSEDHVTARLQSLISNWRIVPDLTDEQLAQQIQADAIDILIDLSGHTADNRLLAFARKPAPIQASWIGTACTTGLQSMDYYLADRHFLPTGQFDEQFTEKIVRLPAGVPFLPSDQAPAVNALPALADGTITFGSFNRLSKLNRPVIALWAQVLRTLPTSNMLLGGMPQAGKHDTLLSWFAEEGIDRSRLVFHGRCSMAEYLSLHHQVDICLDTFPYNGGTTTLHALWMGVPTLTLAGKTPVGRAGAAGLCHAGLDDFIAGTKEEFIQKAVAWAGKAQELAQLRQELRGRVAASPMGRPDVLAKGLTQALRTMWQRWCAGEPAKAFEVNANS